MKTLSETDFFLCVLLFEGWIYLSNWPQCQKPILFLNVCFISPSLVQIASSAATVPDYLSLWNEKLYEFP